MGNLLRHSYLLFFILIMALTLFSTEEKSFALLHNLPPSIAEEVLTESVPMVFAPNDFEAKDFSLVWVGKPIPGVDISLGRESLQWVRVVDFLLLPRGRAIIKAQDIESGQVSNKGFSQNFTVKEGVGQAELPVALISGEKNRIHLTLKKNGQLLESDLEIQFKPQTLSSESRVFTDPSCSPYRVRAQSDGLKGIHWIYVGCRLVYVEGSEHRTPSLEMFVFWDNVGQIIAVDGIETPSTSTSIWPLRLRPSPGQVTLSGGGESVTFTYGIPERLRLGSFGLGVGPYSYSFESSDGDDVHHIAPVLTLYQSFFITEVMRVVAFDATSLQKKFFTDFGIYLNSEYIKFLDRRFVINIMLGAHVIGFHSDNKTHFIFGAPQGFEIVLKDFFLKGHNISAGAFIYPPIDMKLYYNLWLRWGSSSFFGEFNYIAWQEFTDKGRVYSKSIGLSFGLPIGRYF